MKEIGKETKKLLQLLGLFLAASLYSYFPIFPKLAKVWMNKGEYSHGFLVPLFAVVILWIRSPDVEWSKFRPALWGLPVLISALAFRQVSAHFYLEWFDYLSLIPFLFAVVIMFGGKEALRWAWPSVVFLFFMIPLPYSLQSALVAPLRTLGTKAGTYLMQTAGLPAVSRGYQIFVNEQRIDVEEACSGLRMLIVFFAISFAVVFLIHRSWWQKSVVMLSALPIALISNITRITLTGIFLSLGQSLERPELTEFGKQWIHDHAEYWMMPFALLLIWLELWFLSKLFIVEEDKPMSVGLVKATLPNESLHSKKEIVIKS